MFDSMLQQVLYPAPPAAVPSPPPAPLEELPVVVEGQPISTWMHPPTPGVAAVPSWALYLHGNGENLETVRLGGLFDQLAALGVGSAAADYPSYGRTPGKPSQASLTAAGLAAWDALGVRSGDSPRILIGWSLGAAVAAQVASRRSDEVAALILLSPWDNLRSIAKRHFSSFLVNAGVSDTYDTVAALAQVRCPILVLHGEQDDLIPVDHGRQVSESLNPSQHRFIALPRVGHNDLLAQAATWQHMEEFVRQKVAP